MEPKSLIHTSALKSCVWEWCPEFLNTSSLVSCPLPWEPVLCPLPSGEERFPDNQPDPSLAHLYAISLDPIADITMIKDRLCLSC